MKNKSDRFPSAPIINEGPKNVTVLENGTATFECQILSDLGAHIEWIKQFRVFDKKAVIPNDTVKLEVSITIIFPGDGDENFQFRFPSVVGFCFFFGVEFPKLSVLFRVDSL